MCNFCPGIELSKTGGIGRRCISVVVVKKRWGDGDTSVQVDVSDFYFLELVVVGEGRRYG